MGAVIEVTSEKRRAEFSGVGLSIGDTKTKGVWGPGVPWPSVTRMNGEEGMDVAKRGEGSPSRFSDLGRAMGVIRRFVMLMDRNIVRGSAKESRSGGGLSLSGAFSLAGVTIWAIWRKLLGGAKAAPLPTDGLNARGVNAETSCHCWRPSSISSEGDFGLFRNNDLAFAIEEEDSVRVSFPRTGGNEGRGLEEVSVGEVVDLVDWRLNTARTLDLYLAELGDAELYPSSVSYPSPAGDLEGEDVDFDLEGVLIRLGENLSPKDFEEEGGLLVSMRGSASASAVAPLRRACSRGESSTNLTFSRGKREATSSGSGRT
jgi:hypothetical protein